MHAKGRNIKVIRSLLRIHLFSLAHHRQQQYSEHWFLTVLQLKCDLLALVFFKLFFLDVLYLGARPCLADSLAFFACLCYHHFFDGVNDIPDLEGVPPTLEPIQTALLILHNILVLDLVPPHSTRFQL